jgi:hypothetical protein
MRVTPPLAITDARLTSSTVVETAPAAYAGGTTYALNATASVAGSAGLLTVYRSLQASNTGHTPASSPLWWVSIGDTYQVYSGAATYALGDMVIDPTAHLVYESLVAGNIGQALTNATKWQEVGPTNKFAMFDNKRNTKTVVPSPMTVSITAGRRVDSIDLSEMVNVSTINISMVNGVDTVFSYAEDLVTRDVFSYYDYCFKPFSTKKTVARFDLPQYTSGLITIVFTATSGNVEVGSVIVGSSIYIGETLSNPTRDYTNYSTVTRLFDGSIATLVQRPGIPKSRQTVLFEKGKAQMISDLLLTLDATPAAWSGLDDSSNGWFEPVHIIGFVRSGPMDLSHPDYGILTLELESI